MIKRQSQSTVFTPKDFNVDTVYVRYNEKYYKIEDEEKIEISKSEFDKLEDNKIVDYTEEQYTYNEYIEKLQNENNALKLKNTILEQEVSVTNEALFELIMEVYSE